MTTEEAKMAASVEFLEKIKELQDVNYESERKRLSLEKDLNTYAHSDTRLARLKAIRLQNYWKKVCEDEKRSQWRNEQLLNDFDRVESHMEELAARTERLKTMKKQYEEYIERTYPGWKEKVIFMKEQQQFAEKRVQTGLHPAEEAMMHLPPPGHGPSMSGGVSRASAGLAVRHSSPRSAEVQSQNVAHNDSLQYVKDVSRRAQLSGNARLKDVIGGQREIAPGQYDYLMSPGEVFRGPQNMNVEVIPSAGSTLQTISSLPTGTSLTSIQAKALAANTSANRSMDGMQTWQSTDQESHFMNEVTRRVNNVNPRVVQPAEITSKALLDDPSLGESLESPSPKQTTMKAMPQPVHIPNTSSDRDLQTPDLDSRSEDLYSRNETSLKSLTRSLTPQGMDRSIGRRSRQNSQSSILEDKSERSIYPEADVTLDGLYNLLDVVQKSFENTRQNKEFYRVPLQSLPPSVRNEIIENANKGQTLSYVDPVSVSLVALEQLPMVVYNCEGESLLPDSYLYKPYLDPDYDSIRENIHPTSVGFWDRLCQHFVSLIKYNIMNAEDIGETFGPYLIAEDSPYEDKASTLLCSLLECVDAVELASPTSTATLSSMATPKGKIPRPIPNEDVPPLDLPASQSEQSEEVLARPALTQTAAYRQILGSTLTSKKVDDISESDDEDDIERMITKSITSPRVQKPGVQKSNESKPLTVTAKIPGADASKASLGSGVSSDEESLQLSTTTSPPGYVPSALVSTGTGLSTLSMGSTSKANKGAAFRIGDSDTDEDVDLMGTGKSTKHGEEKDDFDFYD